MAVEVTHPGAVPDMTLSSITQLVDALARFELLSAQQFEQVLLLKSEASSTHQLAEELLRRGWLTRYQADRLLEGKGQELVLGDYLLLEPRGEGGMGKVFRGYHRLMKRTVAIKFIRQDFFTHPHMVERFQREIQAVARLNHPHIVVAHDASQVAETHFLVMEYLEGIDLGSLVKQQGPRPVSEACELVRQIALGLQHIHEHGMVHRDLKPSNLMLTWSSGGGKPPHPVLKILDLGLVLPPLEGEVDGDLTGSQVPMGTPAYAAPEQVRNAHDVDIRADLFSLGCTFYYLLTSKPAFPRTGSTEPWHRHEHYTPTPVERFCPSLAPGLSGLIQQMMDKERDNRPRTPAEVVAALTPFCQPGAVGTQLLPYPSPAQIQTPTIPYAPVQGLNAAPGPATTAVLTPDASPGRVETAAEQTSQPGPRWFWIWPLGVLMVLGVSLGSFWMLSSPQVPAPANQIHGLKTPSRPKPSLVKQPPLPVPGEEIPVGELLCFHGHTDWAACVQFIPGTTQLLSGGGDNLLRWDRKTGQLIPFVEGQLRGVRGLVIGPKGHFVTAGGQKKGDYLSTWDLNRAARTNPQEIHTTTVRHVAISPDERLSLSADHDRSVWLVQLDDGKPLRKWTSSGHFPLGVAFLPDHRHALFASWTPGRAGPGKVFIQLWDVAGERETLASWQATGVGCLAFSPDGQQVLLGLDTGVIELREVKTGKVLCSLTGHSTRVQCITFSPDGRRALSGGGNLVQLQPVDCTARLWDLEKGKEVHCFQGHTAPVWGVAFAPDGRRAASASQDKTVRVWGCPDFAAAPRTRRIRIDAAAPPEYSLHRKRSLPVPDVSILPNMLALTGANLPHPRNGTGRHEQ